MRFLLEIALGNAAMQSGREVAHALVRAGGFIDREVGHAPLAEAGVSGVVMDGNGNRVGSYWTEEDDGGGREDRLGFTVAASTLRASPQLGLSASAWHSFVSSPVALALRALQQYDGVAGSAREGSHRYLLIRAQSQLGALLGLACTGEPDGWNADGTVAAWSHNGDTCPVHEWLVPSDQKEVAGE